MILGMVVGYILYDRLPKDIGAAYSKCGLVH